MIEETETETVETQDYKEDIKTITGRDNDQGRDRDQDQDQDQGHRLHDGGHQDGKTEIGIETEVRIETVKKEKTRAKKRKTRKRTRKPRRQVQHQHQPHQHNP